MNYALVVTWADGHLAEYKRIGLSHVVIDFGRDVAGEPSALASPICYAAEIDPTHFGEDKEWPRRGGVVFAPKGVSGSCVR